MEDLKSKLGVINTKLGLANWTQEVATGAIIVGAVALDRWRQQRG